MTNVCNAIRLHSRHCDVLDQHRFRPAASPGRRFPIGIRDPQSEPRYSFLASRSDIAVPTSSGSDWRLTDRMIPSARVTPPTSKSMMFLTRLRRWALAWSVHRPWATRLGVICVSSRNLEYSIRKHSNPSIMPSRPRTIGEFA